MQQVYIVPLEPELVVSTPTYDPFSTETTYKSKLSICAKWVRSKNGHNQLWLQGDDMQCSHARTYGVITPSVSRWCNAFT